MKQERFTAARIDVRDCRSRRGLKRLLPLVATLFLCVHGAVALAGDIARDTPPASMALAEGLYAKPGTSAAVSVVATPTVTAAALPSEPPPKIAPALASASAPAPAVIVAAQPAKAPETSNWISYVAIIAGIVGAITGIAGAIMGALGLRRASKY
jgi:hypothetical protein